MKRSRGRPVGTGKDDSDTILAALKLLATGDAATLTGAIRKVGLSHPSDIRRVREKLKRLNAEFSEAVADHLMQSMGASRDG